MNGGKQKNQKKALMDKKGRPKLQLKGRIFMQNVTDTVCSSKTGNYTCQIFWKGDPGIEFFTIKFPAEDMMRKWYLAVDGQRRAWQDMQRSSAIAKAAGISSTEFIWTKDQGQPLKNPYEEQDEDEDDGDSSTLHDTYNSDYSKSDFSIGRNDSSSSLVMRSRTNTGESLTPMSVGRAPPRQFPMGAQAPVLAIRTQNGPGQPVAAVSPNEYIMDSYFSPTTESPVSTRSSGQINQHVGMFPFPRQNVPMQNGWNGDDNARFTAPAMPRAGSREGSMNGFPRNIQRPSLPPNSVTSQMAQNRLRSASSPDINNALGPRRMADPTQPGIPELPPFPAHYAYQPNLRLNNGSPQSMGGLTRSSTQSPGVQQQRDRIGAPRSIPLPVQDYQGQFQQPSLTRAVTNMERSGPEMRSMTPGSIDARVMTPVSMRDPRQHSPPLPSMSPVNGVDLSTPSQLKVKVYCSAAQSSFVLVVQTTISYGSLKDRIDAKLQRSSQLSLNSGQVKLKYLDEGDYISIQSDEDVQTAFETWREQHQDQITVGQMGEIDLYVQ
jgi:cell division control protein 24